MSKFKYHSSIPADMLPVVKGYLAPFEWAVPGWCERVNVLWDGAGEDDRSMAVVVNFEYRFAELTVYPCWFECKEEVRRNSVIHELIHLHVNPLYYYATRTIKALLDDDKKMRTLALEEARRYCEGVTQDLADSVFKRLDNGYVKKEGECMTNGDYEPSNLVPCRHQQRFVSYRVSDEPYCTLCDVKAQAYEEAARELEEIPALPRDDMHREEGYWDGYDDACRSSAKLLRALKDKLQNETQDAAKAAR